MNVIYKVNREFRVDDNKAFLEALDFCNKNKCKNLFVIYNKSNINNWRGVDIKEKDKMVSQKVLDFIDQQVVEFKNELEIFCSNSDYKNIFSYDNFFTKVTFLTFESKSIVSDIYDFAIKNNVKNIWTDYTPLTEQRSFALSFKNSYSSEINIFEIDSRNIFSITDISDKEEYSAATFRRKWVKLLKQNFDIFKNTQKEVLIKNKSIDLFNNFLDYKIENYFNDRNNALIDGQSNLSPYINMGRISRKYMLTTILQKYNLNIEDIFSENKNGSGDKALGDDFVKDDYDNILLEKNKKINKNILQGLRSFVEEFCIRYELAENYCYYNNNYDNINGLKSWAVNTLQKASTDKREYVYDIKDFESHNTHDVLWNTCQKDLMINNKLNGYLRMYWCKKILQWSSSPQEAIGIAIYLNNKYNLDGYSPTSYTGILWSIGGLHDRAWFPREVFGNIRYMARSGVEKRMDVERYIQKFL